jgi:hypothetical protein
MRTRKALSALLVSALLGLTLLVGSASGLSVGHEPPEPGHRVAICHRVRNETWREITVDKHAVQAHLSGEVDFEVNEENPCPPVAGAAGS